MDNLSIEKLASAIQEAQLYANSFLETPDNGSCNLDTVIIDLKGWRKNSVDKLQQLSGISIGDKLTGIYSGYRFLFFDTPGQAGLRNKMMEAAKKRLCELGFDCSMWYHMD